MLHIDPLADDLRAGHHDLEQPAVGILAVVVRMQKNPAVKIDAAGQSAAPNDKSGVARQPPLRPDLAPVGASAVHRPLGFGSTQAHLDLGKPSASLLAVPRSRRFKIADQLQ